MPPLHITTPLVASRALTLPSGGEVWLKLEALQPPGSFKIRGIGHACETYVRRGATRLISSSGGNAGIAVAYAGRRLGVPVLVVVPETASARAQALIRQEGAQVIVHGPSWQEANAQALGMVTASDAFIHPFDDPLLWAGHAGMIDEVAAAGVRPDRVVVSVGGGGLLCGVIEGLRRNGWADTPVLAVETAGADSFDGSRRANRRIELEAITSLATTLGARQVSRQAFEWLGRHDIRTAVVSDRAAVAACLRFLDDHRILVEPACGAALAAVYDPDPVLSACRSVVVIVCGGATTTLAQLQSWSTSV